MKIKTQHSKTYGIQRMLEKCSEGNSCCKHVTFSKKEERPQVNSNLPSQEIREEQANPKSKRRKEIIKIRVEINDIENGKKNNRGNQQNQKFLL